MKLLVGKIESRGEVGRCWLIRRSQKDNSESAEVNDRAEFAKALTAKLPGTLTLSAEGRAVILRERVREGRWS